MHARADVDASYVALVSVEGPPFDQSITGKLLDTQMVLKGMMEEHESLGSFGTYAWIPEGGSRGRLCGGQRKMGARRARWWRTGELSCCRAAIQRYASGDDLYAAAPTSAAARLLLNVAQRLKNQSLSEMSARR